MKRIKAIKENMIRNTTPRRLAAVLLGNLVLGIGVAALKLSTMGNDPFTASAMAISDGLHISLGTYEMTLNLLLAAFQIIWGFRYIGMGTLFNMFLIGYIVEFSIKILERTIGGAAGHSLLFCLVYMLMSLLVVAFGVSMYQTADLGIAPYDYLSIGLTDHSKRPYFLNRVFTDGVCVVSILVAVLIGFITWDNSHLGVATVACVFCLGPFVAMFNRFNEAWIR